MSEELNKYLQQLDQQKKEKARQEDEIRWKQQKFTEEFRTVFKKVIHETMMKNMEALRGHGRPAKQVREHKAMLYEYEKYFVKFGNREVVIIIYGNYEIEKVCILVEYFEQDLQNGQKKSIKKTEKQYTIPDITADLINTFVVDVVKELAAS